MRCGWGATWRQLQFVLYAVAAYLSLAFLKLLNSACSAKGRLLLCRQLSCTVAGRLVMLLVAVVAYASAQVAVIVCSNTL